MFACLNSTDPFDLSLKQAPEIVGCVRILLTAGRPARGEASRNSRRRWPRLPRATSRDQPFQLIGIGSSRDIDFFAAIRTEFRGRRQRLPASPASCADRRGRLVAPRTLITSANGKSLLRSLDAQGLSVRSMMASMVGPASGYARATQATLLGHSTFAIQRSIKASRAFENELSSASISTSNPPLAAAACESLFFSCFVGFASSVA